MDEHAQLGIFIFSKYELKLFYLANQMHRSSVKAIFLILNHCLSHFLYFQMEYKRVSNIYYFKQINRTLEMCYQQKKGMRVQIRGDQNSCDLRRNRWKKQKCSGPSIFISKTYEILQNDIYIQVVSWNQEGTNFIINDVERFEQEILPIYFRHRNFSSFVRQLNMYDFHKIRNEQNRNIFEHKQFKRNSRQLLKNIKRKGCNSKKGNDNADDNSISEEESIIQQRYDEFEDKHENIRNTVASIAKSSHAYIPSLNLIVCAQQSPKKSLMIEEFINSLPDLLSSEQQVKQIIKEMKKDSKFKCLNSREDIRRVIKKIRRNKMIKKREEDELEQLSIEEQIMVHNIDDQEMKNPSMAILSSQNFLPPKSIGFIGSLILCEEFAYPKN